MLYKILPLLLFCLAVSYHSHAQLLRFQQHYKIGYKTASGQVVVPPIYDAGSEMKEGLAVVLKGNKRGYLNAQGKESIACRYDDASLFENGLACVQLIGKYGFINPAGEWVIQPVYENAFSFKNGLARICRNKKWGMIDRQGTMVIPMIYNRLYDLSDGLIAASMDEVHYGYINELGRVRIDFQYKLSLPFDEETHRALVTTRDGNFYINKKGVIVEKAEDKKEEEEREEREHRR